MVPELKRRGCLHTARPVPRQYPKGEFSRAGRLNSARQQGGQAGGAQTEDRDVIDHDIFGKAMRQCAAGVAVITVRGPGGPIG